MAMIAFLWGLHMQQGARSRLAALEARAAEHQSLAAIAAENLRQLVDRAQVIGRITQDEEALLRPNGWRMVRLLAEDPVFKRISLHDSRGQLLSASHAAKTMHLPAQWLVELEAHTSLHGFKPYLPRSTDPHQQASSPNWRLPFLLPLADPQTLELKKILLVELDVGYLALLLRSTELGESGLVRLLDSADNERLHVNGSGVVISGIRLSPGLPAAQDRGRTVHFGAGQEYQSLFRRMPERGFSIVVSQQRDEILAPQDQIHRRQRWLNRAMTLVILGSMAGALWVMRRRQDAFDALHEAQRINQELISRLEEEHRRSSHAAATDHLSGLHNRRQFIEVATRTLARQRSLRRLTAILFIDMDRFKSINDSLGHEVGDLLLQAVAGRISRLLEAGDEAARFGGDEFVVLLAGERSEEQIDRWVRLLAEKLAAVYVFDKHEVNTSPSIGVGICPRDGQEIEDLIRCADAAMYSAKQSGRGQYRFFDPSLNLSDVGEFALEQTLGAALSERQFVLHYQPQIRLDTMQLVGFEALVRWHHPQFGLLYPDRFIALAERCGFIVALGWEVLRLALDELARWHTRGSTLHMAINVSALQLRQADFSERLLAEMEQRGIESCAVELEITETAIVDEQGLAIDHLRRLRNAGLGISLDDFGTGYAGFAHLNALPHSKLKLDRALIAQLANSYDDNPIVSSTIILAKRLGLEVVAEGVETREQLVYLRLAGCDIAQGYHFSRPMPAEQLDEYPPFTSSTDRTCVQ
jgi:diguanylate cyclase (GGDEF)-like protein